MMDLFLEPMERVEFGLYNRKKKFLGGFRMENIYFWWILFVKKFFWVDFGWKNFFRVQFGWKKIWMNFVWKIFFGWILS